MKITKTIANKKPAVLTGGVLAWLTVSAASAPDGLKNHPAPDLESLLTEGAIATANSAEASVNVSESENGESLHEQWERVASDSDTSLQIGETSAAASGAAVDVEAAGGEWEGLRAEGFDPSSLSVELTALPKMQGAESNTLQLAQLSTAGTVSDSPGGTASPSPGPFSGFEMGGLGQILAVAAGVAVVASAGGGSSSSASSSSGVGGTISDGYISGAKVFRDLDGDGIWDANEPWVTTDSQGTFTGLTGTGGTIIAFGGTDISTGLAFEGVLKAPDGSTAINPLTTLIESLTSNGMSLGDAEAKIADLLGIDLDTVGSLFSTDPISFVSEGGSASLQLAALQAANLLVTINQAIVGSGAAADSEAAAKLLSTALNSVLSSATTLDLADTVFIDSLFDAIAVAAAEEGATTAALAKLDAVAESVGTAISSVNEYIQLIDPTQGLDAVTIAVAAQLTITGAGGLLDQIEAATALSGDDLLALLDEIVAATANMSTLVAANLDDVKDISGDGTNAGDSPPDPVLSLTLDADKASDFYDLSADGTIVLNGSLASLATLGIDNIVGSSGQEVVYVVDGFGTDDLSSLPASLFDSDLNVTLVVDAAADAELSAEGTTLDASLATLNGLGIDQIEGTGSVIVGGGFGATSLADFDVAFIDGVLLDGAIENLDVQVDISTEAADQTIALSSTLKDLADLGIDLVTGSTGQAISVAGLGTDTLTSLGGEDGFGFSDALDVTLYINSDAELSDLLAVLSMEGEASVADVDSTGLLSALNDEANNGSSTFGELGIDHIVIGGQTFDDEDGEWA
jgi:hypothetical protein